MPIHAVPPLIEPRARGHPSHRRLGTHLEGTHEPAVRVDEPPAGEEDDHTAKCYRGVVEIRGRDWELDRDEEDGHRVKDEKQGSNVDQPPAGHRHPSARVVKILLPTVQLSIKATQPVLLPPKVPNMAGKVEGPGLKL